MTSTRAKDFLTKELFIKKNVVTFRSLSRELGIHVNDAKNELAAYLAETANTDTPSFATYMISGLPLSTNGSLVDAMDTNYEDQSVMRSKIVLVDSDGLQNAKLQFARVHSVYTYSLSPSVFRDAHLICEPTDSVRKIDAKGNSALNGKITGAHVKVGRGPTKNASTASSSKTTLDALKPVVPQSSNFPRKSEQVIEKVKRDEGPKEKDSAKPPAGTKEQSKPSGKLDWSRAKSKEQETTEGSHGKDKTNPQPNQELKPSLSSAKLADKPLRNRGFGPQSKMKSNPNPVALEPKKTTKRKSPDPSDSDVDIEDQPTLKDRKAKAPAMGTRGSARVKNGVIMSDDEDEEVPRKPRRKKASDSERSLEAMMDIDDDQVIKMSRLSSRRPDDDVDDTADEIDLTDADEIDLTDADEIDLTDADIPISSAAEEEGDEEEEEGDFKPQAKKKKPKKVAPIGRNGLKKRRVMKSRTTTDTKGYMQTEDYSSYESVSEEDTVPKDAKKLKGKKKAETKLKDEEKEKPVQANPKIKETNSSRPKAKTGKPPKREGLLNFFGPDKTKK